MKKEKFKTLKDVAKATKYSIRRVQEFAKLAGLVVTKKKYELSETKFAAFVARIKKYKAHREGK